MNKLEAPNISELIRTLSPDRFFKFTKLALDMEAGNRKTGMWRDEIIDSGNNLFIYEYNHFTVTLGGGREHTDYYLVAHHIPSYTYRIDFLELMRKDLLDFNNNKAIPKELYDDSVISSDMYYIPNKNYKNYLSVDRNRSDECISEVLRVARSSIGLDVYPIDPLSFARVMANKPKYIQSLATSITDNDGIAISISPSGLSVFPYLTCDVFDSNIQHNANYTFNINHSWAVTKDIDTLLELQDIIRINPEEKLIEYFLADHPDILLRGEYIDFRTQVSIGPDGERPDFFLETSDEFWELLELKRPIENARLYRIQGNTIDIGAYFRKAISQCRRYLLKLDQPDTRRRLSGRYGITYTEPRIVLLIGKLQYPSILINHIKQQYGHDIDLLSFSDLFKIVINNKKTLFNELSALNNYLDGKNVC